MNTQKNIFILLLILLSSVANGKTDQLSEIFERYQYSTLVEGGEQDVELDRFLKQLVEIKPSELEIHNFLKQKGALVNRDEIKNSVKNLNHDRLETEDLETLGAQVFNELLGRQSATGAHFLSCQVSLGIGLPLLAASVVFTTLAVLNSNLELDDVISKYDRKRNQMDNRYDRKMAYFERKLEGHHPLHETHQKWEKRKEDYIKKWNLKRTELDRKFGINDGVFGNDYFHYLNNRQAKIPTQKALAIISGLLSVYPLYNSTQVCKTAKN
jgi:hypothetical protein